MRLRNSPISAMASRLVKSGRCASSGSASQTAMAAAIAALMTPFRNSLRPRNENSRSKPLIGERRLASKPILSVASTKPVCMTDPAIAMTTRSSTGTMKPAPIWRSSSSIACQRMPLASSSVAGSRKRASVWLSRAASDGAANRIKPAPVPSMNRLLISRDWTTWPWLRALASLRPEGCSVFWLSSSAMRQALRSRPGQGGELLGEGGKEPFHARRQHEGKGDETADDLQGLGHEQHLQLRHETADEAERHEEHGAEDDEGRRHLDAEAERAAGAMHHRLREFAERRQGAGHEDVVALDHGAEQQVMEVGEEDQQHADHTVETAGDRRGLRLERIEDLRRGEAELQRHHRARRVEGREQHARHRAEKDADHHFTAHQR